MKKLLMFFLFSGSLDGFSQVSDIIVGYRKQNFLIEIKDGKKKKSAKKLTPDEQEFFDTWKGQVDKCGTLEEIIKVIGL